jgi:RNA polymerase sigma factor (sigma-70 family)
MPPPSLISILRHLRRAAGVYPGLDDAALLERYAADRDEAAFELLVWRHGPMVLGVCRRRLRDIHAAEDAFQATFLALARRAKSIRRRASVAGWLYRVAGRMALAARERSTRRTEQPFDEMMLPGREPEPADAAALRELRLTLDDAIGRLPRRYREPLILTCFAGRSHAEAARELGCAVRTIESRLGRARQKLRAVLLRRGLIPAGGLAAALAPADAPAGVAASLVVATVRAAGHGAASVAIETLTQGVLNAMLLSKIKIAGAVMFVAGFVGLGTGGWVYQSRATGQVPTGEAKAPRQADADKPKKVVEHKPIQKERVRELLRELSETLKDDYSLETIDEIQVVLQGAREQHRARREEEMQAALATVAKDIAILKQVTAGNPTWEEPVIAFERAYRALKQRLDGPAAATARAADPNIPNYTWTYTYKEPEELGTVGTVTHQNAPVIATMAAIQLEKADSVAKDQIVDVVRVGEKPRIICRMRVMFVKGINAIGFVTEYTAGPVKTGDLIIRASEKPK